MMSSCAPGISVVGIDNGYGAACAALRIVGSATMSGRSLWCNPALGVAGDMWLAALLDVGADEAFVRAQLAALALDGWSLSVGAHDPAGPDRDPRRGRRLGSGPPPALVADRRDARDAPARTERVADGRTTDVPRAGRGRGRGARHRDRPGALPRGRRGRRDRRHRRVLGGAGVARRRRSGLRDRSASGSGTATMAHGEVPVPAPAVLELLVGTPTVPVDAAGETATPTGVALLVDDGRPMGTTTRRARCSPPGAAPAPGTPPSHPNVVTAVLSEDAGRRWARPSRRPCSRPTWTTSRRRCSPTSSSCALARGADDAWLTPIVMKKGRPGHVLSVLCRPELSGALRELVAGETGTLGIRERQVAKHELARRDRGGAGRRAARSGSRSARTAPSPSTTTWSPRPAASGRPVRQVARAALAARDLRGERTLGAAGSPQAMQRADEVEGHQTNGVAGTVRDDRGPQRPVPQSQHGEDHCVR